MKAILDVQLLLCWLRRKSSYLLAALLLCLSDVMPALANQEPAPSRGGSILNVLFLACIAYFLVRTFRRRGGGDDSRPGNWSRRDDADSRDQSERHPGKPMDRHEAARQAWSVLSSDDPTTPTADAGPSVVSDGEFNETEFLEGAKLFYTRLQQADSPEELEGLRGFLSEEAYAEALIELQRNGGVRTEVMLLNARLMEMRKDDGRTFTTVFYDAQLRKGSAGEQPVQARTAWEFSRDDSVENALWILEKINKVEQ